jgi:phosphatidate cytidylyltransferase
MQPEITQRLFGTSHAFDNPVVAGLTIGVVGILAVAPVAMYVLRRAGRIDDVRNDELCKRYRSWLVLAPIMLLPVLLGAAYTIVAVGLLSLLCYREFARATGLFRERVISLLVVVGIVLVTLAVLDNWYNLFVALPPLTICVIAVVAILADRPRGYIQRVGLSVMGYMLFGVCIGHLGYFANYPGFRPILFLIVMATELNDVFAYVSGKMFGRRKLAPNTSPNKTVGGAIGATVLTLVLVVTLGRFVFRDSNLDQTVHLIALGLIVGVLGQMGDLLLSSIKRDVGVKDMGALFPGHGGLLDRFDSLVLVAPATFHYIAYFDRADSYPWQRIFTGG